MGLRWRMSWIDENLDGSIRMDLTPAERSVWSDLCDLCGKSRRWGYIERSKGIPWTEEDLAHRFITPLDIVHSCVQKCLLEGRLRRDDDGTLSVTNWSKYQSDKVRRMAENSPALKPQSETNGIPLSPEDKKASRQAAAARLGYLEPDAAGRGIQHREAEEGIKKATETIKEMPVGDE